jgi:hypothetical protein
MKQLIFLRNHYVTAFDSLLEDATDRVKVYFYQLICSDTMELADGLLKGKFYTSQEKL